MNDYITVFRRDYYVHLCSIRVGTIQFWNYLNHSLKFPLLFLFFTLLKAFNIHQVGSKCQSRQRQFTSAVSAPKRLKSDMFLPPFLLSFKQTSLKWPYTYIIYRLIYKCTHIGTPSTSATFGTIAVRVQMRCNVMWIDVCNEPIPRQVCSNLSTTTWLRVLGFVLWEFGTINFFGCYQRVPFNLKDLVLCFLWWGS